MNDGLGHKKSSTGRILAALRALLVRFAILVVGIVVTWPIVSRYAISHGINAIIAYYWITGGVVTLMVLHCLYGRFRRYRGSG